MIGQDDVGALNRFVFKIAMPVALFGLTAQSAPMQLRDGVFAGVYLFSALLILGMSYGVGRFYFKLEKPDAGVQAYGSTLGNVVFLGLPIAQSVESLARPFVVLMLVEGVTIITIASILIAAKTIQEESRIEAGIKKGKDKSEASHNMVAYHWREIALRPFKNPIVMGALGGFIYSLLPLPMPATIATFLDILGRAAGPTALFSLGLFLSTTKVERSAVFSKAVLLIALMKMLVFPLCVYIGLSLVGITDKSIIGACLLFTILPSGITVYIQASQRGRYVKEAATAIAVTTCLSVLSISFILYLLV